MNGDPIRWGSTFGLVNYPALDQPSQHYKHCRQTQYCHCDKYHSVGWHVRQKIEHLPAPPRRADNARKIRARKKEPRVGGARGSGRQKGASGLAGHFAPRSSQAILRSLLQPFDELDTSSKTFSHSHSLVRYKVAG